MTDEGFPRRAAIVGAGLLGGSVAMALRRTQSPIELVAYSRSDSKRKAALDGGVFDAAFDSLSETVRDCDVVVVGTPVDHIADIVCKIAELSPASLITDVGSTKAGIVTAIETHHLASRNFVGAHPIAGSEKTGLAHAEASLFDGKVIVITPGNHTDPIMLNRAEAFWQLTGGRTIYMTPSDHDTHLAAVSHVPHLVSCLVAMRAGADSRPLVGSGWRDITRVAAGDPAMWTAICKENRHAIRQELADISDSLRQLCQMVETADDEALYRWLADAKDSRDDADRES